LKTTLIAADDGLAFVCPETVYYINTKCTKFKLYLFWSGDVQAILIKNYLHFQDLTADYSIDDDKTLPFQYQEYTIEPTDILLLLGAGLLSIKENSFILDHLYDTLLDLPDSNLLATLAPDVYDANKNSCAKLCSIEFKNVWKNHCEEAFEDIEINENDVQNEEDKNMENVESAENVQNVLNIDNVQTQVPFPNTYNLHYEGTPDSNEEENDNQNLIENDKKKMKCKKDIMKMNKYKMQM